MNNIVTYVHLKWFPDHTAIILRVTIDREHLLVRKQILAPNGEFITLTEGQDQEPYRINRMQITEVTP